MVPVLKTKKKIKQLPSTGTFTKVKTTGKIVKKTKKDTEAPTIVLKKEKDPNQLSSVLYLKHVPYGFFEEEALKYFSQYGRVTKIRVMKNEKGGFSGMIYVEFAFPEVATVVQTVMDKSIMMKNHVIKCTQLKEKDVPEFVKYGGLYGDFKPLKKTEHLIQKVEEAYQDNKGDNPNKIDAALKKMLFKAKANGIDYDFDYSKKLEKALKNESERQKKLEKGMKNFINDKKTKEVAAKHEITI